MSAIAGSTSIAQPKDCPRSHKITRWLPLSWQQESTSPKTSIPIPCAISSIAFWVRNPPWKWTHLLYRWIRIERYAENDAIARSIRRTAGYPSWQKTDFVLEFCHTLMTSASGGKETSLLSVSLHAAASVRQRRFACTFSVFCAPRLSPRLSSREGGGKVNSC